MGTFLCGAILVIFFVALFAFGEPTDSIEGKYDFEDWDDFDI